MLMSEALPVKGSSAHSLFKAMMAEVGFFPPWNFRKFFIGVGGDVVGTCVHLLRLCRAVLLELSRLN